MQRAAYFFVLFAEKTRHSLSSTVSNIFLNPIFKKSCHLTASFPRYDGDSVRLLDNNFRTNGAFVIHTIFTVAQF